MEHSNLGLELYCYIAQHGIPMPDGRLELIIHLLAAP